MMEDIGQNPLNDGYDITEILTLKATKQHLKYMNLNHRNVLQKLDNENQILLRKIQKKKNSIQSLVREIALSTERDPETDEFNEIAIQKENALNDVELERAKLEEKNKILSEKIMQLHDRMQSDYEFIHKLCENQAHYIKLYQESLREMEKEQEVVLLEKEMSKVQNYSSQKVKPGTTLVETIQSNMEKNIIKKKKRTFLVRYFRYLFFMIMVFLWILGYMVFHLKYINPDFLVDTLPMLMSRSMLKRLIDILFPCLTLEAENLQPH